MSRVRFAVICDGCGARSEEYGSWARCTECGDDVCPACCATENGPDEGDWKETCTRCAVVTTAPVCTECDGDGYSEIDAQDCGRHITITVPCGMCDGKGVAL